VADDPLGLDRGPGTSRYDSTLDAAAMVAEERRLDLEAAAAERARSARRRTAVIAAGVVLAILVVSLGIAVLTTRRSRPGGAVGVGSGAFSADGLAVPGALTAQFSPDGTRLAVLLGGGSFGLSEAGRLRPIVPAETTITAFSWYDPGRLLVQEGPVSTGQLVAIGVDASDRGVVKLDPDVAPGTGMAVSPDRRTAVVIGTVDSPDIGGASTVDLYAVAIPDGKTRRLTTSPDAESRPVFVDDDRVAYTSRSGGQERILVTDLRDGTTTSLTQAAAHAAVVGAVGGRVLWWDGADVIAGAPGSSTERIASVPSGTTPVTVSPDLRQVVVREVGPEGDTILRLVRA
jgi:hypothetical protein